MTGEPISLATMRRNAEDGAYSLIGRPHVLALIDAVEASYAATHARTMPELRKARDAELAALERFTP